MVIGLLFVYSASFYSAQNSYNNKYFFFFKQLLGALVGIISLTFFVYVDLNVFKKIIIPILIAVAVLLGLVFVPHVGIENYGARRWIGFLGFSFQPSEFAKFAFVIFCAVYMSSEKVNMSKFIYNLPILFVGFIYCLLIVLEPNMSITMCLGMVMLFMLFVGGMKFKNFVLLLLPIVVLLPVIIFIEPYRVQRLLAFIDPWASPKDEGYQLIQSLYALGSGGWFGVGIFNSRQKYGFLPFSESDFIFSIIGEELGFVGASFVILLFLIVILRGIRISINSPNVYCSFLASGITSVIAIQSLMNLAVVTGSTPPTGLPLPFISYGGTSLVVFCSAIGILLNISSKIDFNT